MNKESSEKEKKNLKRSRKDDGQSCDEPKRSKKSTANAKEEGSNRKDSKPEKATRKQDKSGEKEKGKSAQKKSEKETAGEAVKSSGKDCVNGGFGWKASQPLPKRKANGVLVFADFPDFQPNRTPKEVLQASPSALLLSNNNVIILVVSKFTMCFPFSQSGSFGGTYFRSIYSSVAKEVVLFFVCYRRCHELAPLNLVVIAEIRGRGMGGAPQGLARGPQHQKTGQSCVA